MNIRQVAVGNLSELHNGDMKQVSVEGAEILLARVNDRCFAVGAHCPHYGAPLVEGTLSGDRLVCPWHHACFNVENGDCEEPPAFDALPSFPVSINNGEIVLHLPAEVPDRRVPEMTKRNSQDKRVFVVLGAGAAGFAAAQTLREDGFGGRLVMITGEDRLPYDRPNLSKDYLQGHAEPAWMPLRSKEFFKDHDITTMLGRTVSALSVPDKVISFVDGETFNYDSIVIATGCVPRRLPSLTTREPQSDVFVLRSFSDSDAIAAAAADGKKVVLIGASFIGMEAACSLKIRGCDVTVVAPDAVPFEKTLGPEIGRLFQRIHERNGVRFQLGKQVSTLDGDESVKAVVLDTGERLEADLVVVGIGVSPATGFIEGIQLHDDGGVITDRNLMIAKDTYAAGDIVHFPAGDTGELIRIEHWRIAMQQGRTAAHNMAGKPSPFEGVPFFWTTQFGSTLNYVGHTKGWDQLIIDGDIGSEDFLAFYVKNARVRAVAGMNRDRDIAVWEELIRLDKVPPLDRVVDSATQVLPAGSRRTVSAGVVP